MELVQNVYVCEIKKDILVHDQIFPLKKDTAIVIKANIDNKETQIICDEETEHFWTGASIIFFPGCTLVSNKAIMTPTKQSSVKLEQPNNKNQEEELKPVDILIDDFKEDPRIKQLRTELDNILTDDFLETKNHVGNIF